jgi:hypothetical protein
MDKMDTCSPQGQLSKLMGQKVRWVTGGTKMTSPVDASTTWGQFKHPVMADGQR